MTSKQATLRTLMRAEQEKVKPKGILKQPKAKQSATSKEEFVAKHGGKKTNSVGKTSQLSLSIQEEKESGKRKRYEEDTERSTLSSQHTSNEEDLELQEFFDSVENDQAVEDASESQAGVTSSVQQTVADSSPVAQDQDINVTKNSKGAEDDNRLPADDIEQIAYEARLAKLMLLTRQRRAKKHDADASFDDTAKEVGASLDMTINQKQELGNDETKTSPSASVDASVLRDILKKKKQKLSQTVRQGEMEEEEDAYWSNY